jgi:hypothetical protein
VRTESLLLALLAHKVKEKGFEAEGSLNPPHWSFQCQFNKSGLNDNESSAPKTLVDYVLWYGHHCELETNMIVMKSSTPVLESWKLLENMAFIHHTRKLAKRDASIYGVMTDGSDWIFMHLNDSSRVRDIRSSSKQFCR